MPQFIPLLAASEPVYGTLSAGTKDYMRHALLDCKDKTGLGNSKAVARAGFLNPRKPHEWRSVGSRLCWPPD